MPITKSKSEMATMPIPNLISYLESLDDNTYNGYIDADTKVRYFLGKYGKGIVDAIRGTNLFFPSVVAQSILESGYGRKIPKDSNNFAGIKYAPNLRGVIGYVEADTSEYIGGKKVFVKAKFSKFKDVESGFKAHVQVLLQDNFKNAREKATSPEEQILMFANSKPAYTSTPAKEYLSSMQGNINRVRDKTKIAKVN